MKDHLRWVFLLTLILIGYFCFKRGFYEGSNEENPKGMDSVYAIGKKVNFPDSRTSSHSSLDPKRTDAQGESSSFSMMKVHLKNNDLCPLLKLMAQPSDEITTEDLASLLDEDTGFADKEELNTAHSVLTGPSKLKWKIESEEGAKFYFALYLGKLLSKWEPKHPNKLKSFKLLSELMEDHPENGAYPYFRASLRDQLKHDVELIHADLMKAMTAKEFNPWFLKLEQSIYQWGLMDASHYAVATQIMAKMPMPLFNETTLKLIPKWIEGSNPRAREATLQFGTKLMEKSEKNSSRREIVFWMALDWVTGRFIAKRAWEKQHPGAEFPPFLADKNRYKTLTAKDPYLKPWSEALDYENCKPDLAAQTLEKEIRDLSQHELIH